MATLAKLCLVLSVVLGLTSAYSMGPEDRTERTGGDHPQENKKCKAVDMDCGGDYDCCSSRCQLRCPIGPRGRCERKCADCKHRNEPCQSNGDCCSQACAPTVTPATIRYTCTDEEPWDQHDNGLQGTDNGPPTEHNEDQGEGVSLTPKSTWIDPSMTSRYGSKSKGSDGDISCVRDGHPCTIGRECCSPDGCHYPNKGVMGYCKVPKCLGFYERCDIHDDKCCEGLFCDTDGTCYVEGYGEKTRTGPNEGSHHDDLDPTYGKTRTGPKEEQLGPEEEETHKKKYRTGYEEENPNLNGDDVTGASNAKETLGKLLKAVFDRFTQGKGIKMTVDVKNPEAVINGLKMKR